MSANPHQGEHSFTVNGVTYTLALNWRSLGRAERLADKPVGWLMQNLHWLSTLSALFFAGLERHHPSMTQDDVDALLAKVKADEALKIISEALKAAFPQEEKPASP